MALHYTTLRGSRLVWRKPADIEIRLVEQFDVKPEHFYDGDYVDFPGIAITPSALNIEVQCFRVGRNGSTLTPVARGSWETK